MRKTDQIYWIWADMRSRCLNPNHRSYDNYGGRGITVCPRWEKYAHFRDDMGSRPTGLMLDRIDNNGNYEPGNCRWTTRQEQNSNRRYCIYVNDGGEAVTLKEYCRRHGLKYRPIHKRIRQRGWPIERALNEPLRVQHV